MEHKDTYFLDRDLAYRTALAHNIVELPDGTKDLQLCYYDGDVYDNAPNNLINVPMSQFSQFFIDDTYRLPQAIDTTRVSKLNDDDTLLHHNFGLTLSNITLLRQRKKQFSNPDENCDLLFLDPQEAHDTALLQNTVVIHQPNIHGLQICYYDGDEFPNAPNNLVRISFDDMLDYFTNSRLRLPQGIVTPSNTTQEQKAEVCRSFALVLDEVAQRRERLAEQLAAECKSQRPVFKVGESLRVQLFANRYTDDVKADLYNLQRAFDHLACHTHLTIEHDSMECVDDTWLMREALEFNPHVTININDLNNSWLQEEVFNIVWWKDPMQLINFGKSLSWRDRDIVFSTNSNIDRLLRNSGMPSCTRQDYCIDRDVYQHKHKFKRHRKIIFNGDNLLTKAQDVNFSAKQSVSSILQLFESREHLTIQLLESTCKPKNASRSYFWGRIFLGAARIFVLRHISQISDIPLEVYGDGWQQEPTIAPYVRGIKAEDHQMAELYSQVSHVFSCGPLDRMARDVACIRACGATPMLLPYWHEKLNNNWQQQSLCIEHIDAIMQKIRDPFQQRDPLAALNHHDYDNFAKIILNIISHRVRKQTVRSHERGKRSKNTTLENVSKATYS